MAPSIACVSVILALLALCYAQNNNTGAPLDNCSNLTTEGCFSCLSMPGCGWCAPTLSCHTGNFSAPTDDTVCIQEWFGAGGTMLGGACPEMNCPGYSNCVSCLKEKSCGWCEPSNNGPSSCMALGQTCPGGANVDQSCPCQEYNSCEDCVDDGDCVFCISSHSCQTIDVTNGNCKNDDPNDQLTNNCPCTAWTDCDTCNGAEGCGWCDGKNASQNCVDIQSTTCQLAHTCHEPCSSSHHFNAGSFVGGMFVMLGAIVLIAGAYFLYSHWVSRRTEYQQVN